MGRNTASAGDGAIAGEGIAGTGPWGELLRAAVSHASLTAAVFAGAVLAGGPAASATQLVPHRAVYDMELGEAREGVGVTGVAGRMVYEFTGNACEGYSVSFRFVTQVSDADGGVRLTDLQTSSFEDASGDVFQFLSKTYVNRALSEETRGRAEHEDGRIAIALVQPTKKNVAVKEPVLFPTEHLKRLIAAASRGEKVLVADIYDGSETGEKVYATTSIIGERHEGAGALQDDAAEAVAKIGAQRYWPVTISYFDQEDDSAGEKTPIYQLGFLLYENGVSRRLLLDYGDFEIKGRLVDYTPIAPTACDAEN